MGTEQVSHVATGEAKKPKKKKNKAKQLNVQVKLRAQVLLKESAISKAVLQATEQKNKRNKVKFS